MSNNKLKRLTQVNAYYDLVQFVHLTWQRNSPDTVLLLEFICKYDNRLLMNHVLYSGPALSDVFLLQILHLYKLIDI